jgi:AmmeMemoRadiSam system protein A
MDALVLLAKRAIETFVKKGKIILPPDNLPEEFLKRKSGTFITIMKDSQLRGCIGTYLQTKENIAQEVIRNAIAAASEDYRFSPIKEDELPYLSYTVYILSEPELAKALKESDPKKYGIIVRTNPLDPSGDVVFNGHFVAKTGLLLPDLEGVNTVEQQLSVACHKAGINPKEERIFIYRFTVEKFQ